MRLLQERSFVIQIWTDTRFVSTTHSPSVDILQLQGNIWEIVAAEAVGVEETDSVIEEVVVEVTDMVVIDLVVIVTVAIVVVEIDSEEIASAEIVSVEATGMEEIDMEGIVVVAEGLLKEDTEEVAASGMEDLVVVAVT